MFLAVAAASGYFYLLSTHGPDGVAQMGQWLRSPFAESYGSLPPYLRRAPGPRATAAPEFAGRYADEMLWGSYCPEMYVCLKTRSPRPLLFGLLWTDASR